MNNKSFSRLYSILKNYEQESIFICLAILAVGIVFGNSIGIFFTLALILFSFWHPELSLVLIFFSGFLKNIEVIQNLPIDLTVLAVLLLLFHSLIRISKIGKLTKLNCLDILIILQGCLVLFSVHFISSGTELNWWDANRFIIFNLALYFGPFLLSLKQKEAIRIIHWIVYGILVIASSAFHNLIFGQIFTWHISSFGESYIHLALLICLGILYFLNNILSFKQKLKRKAIHFVLLGSLVFMIPFIPSRSVLLSLCLAFFFISFKFSWKTRLRFISILVLLIIFAYIGLNIATNYGVNVERIYSYSGIYAVSLNYRVEAIKSAIEDFKENPILGTGMGEFMYQRGGKGNYPHNLFVESLVAFGVLSIFIFWPTFLISFKYSVDILKKQKLPNLEIVALWFIFFFFESFFSGSLSSFRTLWLLMGILSIFHKTEIKK